MIRMLALLCLLAAAPWTARAQDLVKLKAGMVTGIDQIGLPIALERGFFEKHGLDVEIARPTPRAWMRSTRCRPARARPCRSACR